MSMWSTRSAASMNDIDIDERRLRMGRRGDGLPFITGDDRLVMRPRSTFGAEEARHVYPGAGGVLAGTHRRATR